MKKTHTMTTTHDIPDHIREALKIREDLDGISGTVDGLVVLHHRQSTIAPVALFFPTLIGCLTCAAVLARGPELVVFLMLFLFGFIAFWMGQRALVVHRLSTATTVSGRGTGYSIPFKWCFPYLIAKWLISPKLHSFSLGHTQFAFGNEQFAYLDVQRISVVYATIPEQPPSSAGIHIVLRNNTTPHVVALPVLSQSLHWLVEQIQARMAAAQSGTVPEALTRLTKQADETESSTRPVNASATKQTT